MPQYSIDPSAFVHPTAQLAEGVVIGQGCHVGPRCVIGPRTVMRPHSTVVQDTTIGADNILYDRCVIGGDPQDRSYKPEKPGVLIVGDRNMFRECVTISRSTEHGVGEGKPTRIGDGCFFMAYAHVGHNTVVGNNVTLTNASAIGGHCQIGDGAMFSGYGHVHQFCRVGAFALFRGASGASMHVPPYVMIIDHDMVVGLNRVGLRRSGRFTPEDMRQIKEVFRIIYRTSGPLMERLARAEAVATLPGALAFTDFVRAVPQDKPPYRRGMVGPGWRRASRHLEVAEIE